MTIFYAVPGESQILTGDRQFLPKDAIQMVGVRPEQTDAFEIVAQADGTWGKKVYTDAEQDARRERQYVMRTQKLLEEIQGKQIALKAAADQAEIDAINAVIAQLEADYLAERVKIKQEYPKAGEPGGASL